MAGELNENRSLTEIANSALVQIGETPIYDISDTNDGRAGMVRVLLKQAVREIQVHHAAYWDELLVDENLTLREHGDGLGEDVFRYNVPLNLLAIHGLFDENGCSVDWRMVGGVLCTKRPAKQVRYIRLSMNPDEWSAELRSCVIELLAARLVAAIVKDFTTSKKLVATFWQIDFPRLTLNRRRNGSHGRRGDDSVLRREYPNGDGEIGSANTSYY